TRDLDTLPTTGSPGGRAFRDPLLESRILALTGAMNTGAQFGGKYFCHDVRVIRLPRHNGSLPIGLGVSCSADRQVKARITAEGASLEALEDDPARFLPDHTASLGAPVPLDLARPMAEIRAELQRHPVGTAFRLSGPMIVARDLV